jgi:malyl-CoA/(S)-citramalyl-CoA lyase
MKLPRNFFKPLAIGAPAPLRELPVKLERMIHFVPPQIEKLRAKVPELIAQVDVVLGNLEDAIPADAKEAARAGFIEMAKANDFDRHRPKSTRAAPKLGEHTAEVLAELNARIKAAE